MQLTKHQVWEVFPDAATFESFQKKFAELIFIKKEVPEVVKKSAAISEKLLLHSYYEYGFIDVSLTHAIFAFEKALRIKWAEIHGKESKLQLAGLIDWFYKERYFETLNDGLPHQLRHIRNGKVHDTNESLGGVVFIRKVYDTYLLINDLYEDVQLRIKRTDTRHKLSDALSKLTTTGAMLYCNDQRLILFSVFPIFINNKSNPEIISLFVCPIFDQSPYTKNEVYTPKYTVLKLRNWSLKDDVFEGIDIETEKPIYIKLIEDKVNASRFTIWSENFWNYENATINLFSTSQPIDDLFIKELQEFQRT